MIQDRARNFRDQAAKCRDLANLADELHRKLMEVAREFDELVREAEKTASFESRAASRLVDSSVPETSARSESRDALAVSIRDAAALVGLGRSTIYRLIGEGQLQTIKIGRRTLIRTASIRKLAGMPD